MSICWGSGRWRVRRILAELFPVPHLVLWVVLVATYFLWLPEQFRTHLWNAIVLGVGLPIAPCGLVTLLSLTARGDVWGDRSDTWEGVAICWGIVAGGFWLCCAVHFVVNAIAVAAGS